MESTAAASSELVVVKNEIDHDTYTYLVSSAPDFPTDEYIKHEVPLDLNAEPATEDLTQCSTTAESAFDAAGECDASSSECKFTAHDPGLAESFVIYEFDSAADEATNEKSAKQPITQSAPTLLNENLRKRSKSRATATVVAAVHTSTAMEMLTVAQPATKTPSELLATPTMVSVMKMNTQKNTPTMASTVEINNELKVKCICRLGFVANRPAAPANNGPNLKEFFQQIFDETRLLRREQQRTVQMALLKAVCQAEADVEAGNCCAICCSQL